MTMNTPGHQTEVVERHEFWTRHINAWKHSGQTRAVYCDHYGLSLQKFAYWRKRLKKKASLNPTLVQLPHGILRQAVSPPVRVIVDERYVIEVTDEFNASTLARVLDVVQGR